MNEIKVIKLDKLISKIVRKHLMEVGADGGTGATDLDATTQLQMATTLWEQGYPAFRDVFAQRVTLPKGITTYKFPVPAKNTALEAGGYPSDPAKPVNIVHVINTYVPVVADLERGVNMAWNRSYLDLATWDVMAQHLKEAGRMIETKVFHDCLDELATDAHVTNLTTVSSYATFLAGVAAVNDDDYVCDTCLCSVAIYFLLLNDDKFISTVYVGSPTIASGKLETTLGVTIFPTTVITVGAMFLDSKKALGLAVLRDRTFEEYSYPDTDSYGFVATMVYGADCILPNSVVVTSGFTT